MKKLLILCFMAMLASDGLAQSDSVDYSLEGLAKVCAFYDEVSSFHDGLALVRKDYKCGFINKKGIEVIPCIYDSADDFQEGLALVRKREQNIFIDKGGNEVIKCKYNIVESFTDGMARVIADVNGHSKVGFINQKGEEVIPCKYQGGGHFCDGVALVLKDDIWFFIDKNDVKVISKERYINEPFFREGLAQVEKEGKYGYINKQGIEVIPCIYDRADDFHEGLAYMEKTEYTNGEYYYKRGYINKEGVEVALWNKSYENDCPPNENITEYFSEGLSCFRIKCRFGYVDKNKNFVISPIYCDAKPFSEGFAVVSLECDDYFFIDKNGNKITSSTYDKANSFSDGLALVLKNNKWGYIDMNGKSTFDY